MPTEHPAHKRELSNPVPFPRHSTSAQFAPANLPVPTAPLYLSTPPASGEAGKVGGSQTRSSVTTYIYTRR